MKRLFFIVLAVAVASGGGFTGCSSGAKKGGAIGAAVGGLIGGVVGSREGDTAEGAIIGAVVGGAAGAVIGDYMDKQAEEIDQGVEGATVERVGEGIQITFDSGILFAVNKSDLSAEAQTNLVRMAGILNKYEDTNLIIEGHTDATGSDEYNQTLSERRATAVKAFLIAQSVSPTRMTSIGYGESQPVADNETENGRRQNRRVEVAIIANEELKQAAEAQSGKG